MAFDLDDFIRALEVSLVGIGVLAEIVGELIPDDRPELEAKLVTFLQMSSDVLEQGNKG